MNEIIFIPWVPRSDKEIKTLKREISACVFGDESLPEIKPSTDITNVISKSQDILKDAESLEINNESDVKKAKGIKTDAKKVTDEIFRLLDPGKTYVSDILSFMREIIGKCCSPAFTAQRIAIEKISEYRNMVEEKKRIENEKAEKEAEEKRARLLERAHKWEQKNNPERAEELQCLADTIVADVAPRARTNWKYAVNITDINRFVFNLIDKSFLYAELKKIAGKCGAAKTAEEIGAIKDEINDLVHKLLGEQHKVDLNSINIPKTIQNQIGKASGPGNHHGYTVTEFQRG